MSNTALVSMGIATLALTLAPMSIPAAAATVDAATAPPPEVVILQNHTTGRCLDIPGPGLGKRLGPVQQWYCRPGLDENQRFQVLPQGMHGTYQRFLLQNQKDGLCLDLPGAGAVPTGTKLREGLCLVADNQAWYRVPVRGKAWLLVNEKSKLCLDVVGAKSRKPNTPLAVTTCSMTDDHVWRMRPPAKVKPQFPKPKPVAPTAPKPAPKAVFTPTARPVS